MPSSKSKGNALAALLEEQIRAIVAETPALVGSAWMRATDSPLGFRRVRRLVADGALQAARPGKFLLVRRDEHDAYIAQHAVTVDAANEGDDLASAFGVERAS